MTPNVLRLAEPIYQSGSKLYSSKSVKVMNNIIRQSLCCTIDCADAERQVMCLHMWCFCSMWPSFPSVRASTLILERRVCKVQLEWCCIENGFDDKLHRLARRTNIVWRWNSNQLCQAVRHFSTFNFVSLWENYNSRLWHGAALKKAMIGSPTSILITGGGSKLINCPLLCSRFFHLNFPDILLHCC